MARRNSIKGEMRDEVVSQFTLLAEAEGDKTTYHRPRIRKDAGIVYCIEIGKDHYVGSTFDPQERSRSHMGTMASGAGGQTLEPRHIYAARIAKEMADVIFG